MPAEGDAVEREEERVDDRHDRRGPAHGFRQHQRHRHQPDRRGGLARDEGTVVLAPVGDPPHLDIGRIAAEQIDLYRTRPAPVVLEDDVDQKQRAEHQRRYEEDDGIRRNRTGPVRPRQFDHHRGNEHDHHGGDDHVIDGAEEAQRIVPPEPEATLRPVEQVAEPEVNAREDEKHRARRCDQQEGRRDRVGADEAEEDHAARLRDAVSMSATDVEHGG